MSAYSDLKAARPIRFIIAVTVFRAIWWPWMGLLLPFAVLGAFVDWLSWTAFPAIARTTRPILAAPHTAALAVGNAILGYRPKDEV